MCTIFTIWRQFNFLGNDRLSFFTQSMKTALQKVKKNSSKCHDNNVSFTDTYHTHLYFLHNSEFSIESTHNVVILDSSTDVCWQFGKLF